MLSWKLESLHRLFNPESIAVIGASEKPEKLGALSLMALRDFEKPVYPVNPGYPEIQKKRCYPSIQDIPERVDLALIAVGPQQVLDAVRDCAAAQVGGAVIFSAGFKELGGFGVEHQRRVKEVADDGRLAIIGPNCLGAGNLRIGLNATFFPHPVPIRGGTAGMASQSGGVTGLMLYRAADERLGVSKFASIGNRVNIDFHDMVSYFREDEDTSTICLFVEGTEQGREMIDEIRKTTPEKPVVVYKVGKTPASREAALSHTGSLAGNEHLYSAAFRQSRAIEVSGVSEMIDTAKLLSFFPDAPKGRSVAVVTHTLGIALIAAQALEERGVEIPMPSDEIVKQVQNLIDLPVEVPIKNPIDVLAKGWAEPEVFTGAFKLALNSPHYDAVVICFAPNFIQGIGGGVPVHDILRVSEAHTKPVVCVLSAPHTRSPPGMEELEDGGIPVFLSPERAGHALSNLLSRTTKISS